MNLNNTVCIIGCGVSGLSTAYLLLEHGWDVTIISKHDPRKPSKDPAFASVYPAASIIPHSVNSDRMESLFQASQSFFKKLHVHQFPGINLNQHFELFADPRPLPAYQNLMDNFEEFEEFKTSFHPAHPQIPILSGWKFQCYFADWNLYFPALLRSVIDKGATLKIKVLEKDDLQQLPYHFIVNCSELGAIDLFEDPFDLIYRGHILQIPETPKLTGPNGETISYNFTPGPDVYQTENGNPQDVYCYPRSDGWILGGSRQRGKMDSSGNWIGEETAPPFNEIDQTKFPAQIPELHKRIIQHTYGVNLDQFIKQKIKVGYRYLRKEEDGLRLETQEMGNKLFIHNYGHGGAGVTLSWGCAGEVVKMLEKAIG